MVYLFEWDMQEVKKDILQEFLRVACESGVGGNTIYKIAVNLNIAVEEIMILFNNVDGIIEFYFKEVSGEMRDGYVDRLEGVNGVSKKIEELIIMRIGVLGKHKKSVREMSRYMLCRPLLASKILRESVNEMWELCGDRSIDFNYYTKRFSLSKIYSLVLGYYFCNEDEDLSRTRKFCEDVLKRYLITFKEINKFKNMIF